MRFNRMFALLGISVIFSTVNSAFADEKHEKINQANVELSIKPLVCMVKTINQRCEMTITVNWHSETPLDACLQNSEQTLACWENENSVKQQFKLSLESDMLFQLIDNNNTPLAEKHIKLNIANPPKYRRRLRAQWSLF